MTECTGALFERPPGALVCSFVDTTELELSEHPHITNAKLAISKRATDRIFIALPFLMICGMDEDGTSEPPLTKQVRFSLLNGTAGSSGWALQRRIWNRVQSGGPEAAEAIGRQTVCDGSISLIFSNVKYPRNTKVFRWSVKTAPIGDESRPRIRVSSQPNTPR